MQISKRLGAVAGMVTPGCTVADIGTDHAYIPIRLVGDGIAPRAIAMDINRGPLAKAAVNIRQYALEEKIETRRSDGMEALLPGEAESIIIAGMGGALTVRILTNGAACVAACRELILQPQSEIWLVRKWLEQNGFVIDREELIAEDGKYYPMMHGVHRDTCITASERMSEAQLRYGPELLKKHHPVLREYLQREQRQNGQILEALAGRDGANAAKRRAEVEREQTLIEEVLEHV